MDRKQMTFADLERQMRSIENAREGEIPADAYIIARLDGRGFSKLTKAHFEKPFDERFHRLMVETMCYLMEIEPDITLAYNQSDEISVLIMTGSSSFNRKARKILSLLPSAAAAKFSLRLGEPVSFDCRLNIQHDEEGVIRYFRWRSIDAERNAFNACAYWLLRKQGMDPQTAAEYLRSLDTQSHRKLLQDHHTDSTVIPVWQTRGVIVHRITEMHEGFNPLTHTVTTCTRRRLAEEDYSEALLQDIISTREC
ncbi:MAG: hypothetical protein MR894_08040 [Akkermansia muciniphila]|nr:hypothetical protein [Akkermansia muciniphila]